MSIGQKIVDFIRFGILHISKTISEDGKYKIYSLFGIKIRKKRKQAMNFNDQTLNNLEFEKSHYFLLVDKLLDRSINKNFDINFKEKLDIVYSDVYFNIQYVCPHKNFFHILEKNSYSIPDIAISVGIGAHLENYNIAYFSQFNHLPYIIMEDGFLRSVTTWAQNDVEQNFWHGLSFVFDNIGPYFDATRPSLLENMLNDKNLILTKEQIKRAKKLIQIIVKNHLTKYNHQPIFTPDIGTRDNKILVVDQSYGDMSIARGLANDKTFDIMLKSAIRENPNADIIVKTHPDTITGKRSGYYVGLKQHNNIYPMTEPINPISMINYVDKVYVVTSQFGFEALMCKKEVHIFGVPFYAGYGLANERQSVSRRTNKRTLEEVFYISYILYTRYFNPYTKNKCEIEEAIDCLLQLRAEYQEKYERR